MPHADPVVRRRYMAEWKRKNSVRHKLLNKYADAAMHANQRAYKYDCEGTLTAADVRDCLSVGECHYCKSPKRLGVDHKIPLKLGGPNTRENIVPACNRCNVSKFNTDRPDRWSRHDDACRKCGKTEIRHVSRGLCSICYGEWRRNNNPKELNVARQISETAFLAQVVKAARLTGWMIAHFRPALTNRGWRTPVQGDGAGWPDCVLVHPKKNRLIVAELKSESGVTSPEQEVWLSVWRGVPAAEVHVIRPSDFDWFFEELKR